MMMIQKQTSPSILGSQIRVELNEEEMRLAAALGASRRIKLRDKKDVHPNADYWGNEIESANAELAAAKALNAYWSGPLGAGHPDLHNGTTGIEVKWATRPHYGLLIPEGRKPAELIRPLPHVLVTGELGRYVLAGWAWGYEIVPSHWNEKLPKPGWLMPQKELHPMATFPGWAGQ